MEINHPKVWNNVKILVLKYEGIKCHYQFLGECVYDLGNPGKVDWMNILFDGYINATLIS